MLAPILLRPLKAVVVTSVRSAGDVVNHHPAPARTDDLGRACRPRTLAIAIDGRSQPTGTARLPLLMRGGLDTQTLLPDAGRAGSAMGRSPAMGATQAEDAAHRGWGDEDVYRDGYPRDANRRVHAGP